MIFLKFYFDFYSIIVEIYLLIGICFLLLFGAIISLITQFGYTLIKTLIKFLTFQLLFLALILICNQIPIYALTWNNFLILDSFSFFSKIIILIISNLWFILIFDYDYYEKINNFEFWILALLGILSLLLFLQIFDLLSTYVLLELQSLIFYILTSTNKKSEFSTEAGIKYFILGAFASAFLLFSFSYIYSITGLTNFNDLMLYFSFSSENLHTYDIYLLLLFLSLAFLFKLGGAPFHNWAPDVYEGAPSSVTAFFLLLPKLVILNLILRFTLIIFPVFFNYWSSLFFISILLSTTIGTFSTFKQTKWKRFISFSALSNLSFFLVPIVCSDINSITYLFIYLFIYLVLNLIFLLIFINFYSLRFPSTKQIRFLISLKNFNLLNPTLAFSIMIVLFSMAGIPPLAGFFSKFLILLTAINSKIFGSVIIILGFNCISSFYYIKFVRLMYFNLTDLKAYLPIFINLNKSNSIVLGIMTWFVLTIFFDFELLQLIAKLLMLAFF